MTQIRQRTTKQTRCTPLGIKRAAKNTNKATTATIIYFTTTKGSNPFTPLLAPLTYNLTTGLATLLYTWSTATRADITIAFKLMIFAVQQDMNNTKHKNTPAVAPPSVNVLTRYAPVCSQWDLRSVPILPIAALKRTFLTPHPPQSQIF